MPFQIKGKQHKIIDTIIELYLDTTFGDAITNSTM